MITYILLSIVIGVVLLVALASLIPTLLVGVLWIVVVVAALASMAAVVFLLGRLIYKIIKKAPKEEIKQSAIIFLISIVVFLLLRQCNNVWMPMLEDWAVSLVMH